MKRVICVVLALAAASCEPIDEDATETTVSAVRPRSTFTRYVPLAPAGPRVVPWTPGLEAILVAGLAAQRDAKGEAREALAFAAQELEALGWGLHAAAATWQRSRLSGEDARLPALVQEQRLAAPERYLAMLAPIF